MAKFTNMLFKTISVIAGVLFLGATALTFANVVGRYVFSAPIFWAEEITVYGIIWCVMLGGALASWRGEHLRVEIIEMFLGDRFTRRLQTVVLIVVASVAAIIAYYGWGFVEFAADMDQRSVVSGIPMTIPFAAIPVGFLLVAVASVVRLIQKRAAVACDGHPAPQANAAPAGDMTSKSREPMP